MFEGLACKASKVGSFKGSRLRLLGPWCTDRCDWMRFPLCIRDVPSFDPVPPTCRRARRAAPACPFEFESRWHRPRAVVCSFTTSRTPRCELGSVEGALLVCGDCGVWREVCGNQGLSIPAFLSSLLPPLLQVDTPGNSAFCVSVEYTPVASSLVGAAEQVSIPVSLPRVRGFAAGCAWEGRCRAKGPFQTS